MQVRFLLGAPNRIFKKVGNIIVGISKMSYFKEGDKLSFYGFKGIIIKITETYRKNVLVLKVNTQPARNPYTNRKVDTIGIFEYPDGTLEFMTVID